MIANPQFTKWVPVTQSDADDFPVQGTADGLAAAIYVGGAGDVACVHQDGRVVTIPCIAGMYIWGKFKRINDTGTTVTNANLFALYDL